MADEAAKLRLVPGDRPEGRPRAGRRTGLDQSEQVTCWRCHTDTGVETSAVVSVVIAPRRKPDGTKTGGTKAWACAFCLARGHITELLRG